MNIQTENDAPLSAEVISCLPADAGTPLAITGAMTIYEAAELKSFLLGKLVEVESLVIDLSSVSDIDTTGLQLLLALRRDTKPVTLINPSHCVQQIAELLQLHSLLGLTVEESGVIS